jgi:hypothetical protein
MAPRVRRIAFSALLVSAALLGTFSLSRREKLPAPQSTPREQNVTSAALPLEPTPPGARAVLASAARPSTPLPAKPPAEELRQSHPITPQHERIYRENQLTFALDGAVDVQDARGIRRLLASYRQEFPEDSLVLQQGYELIADCLERPGEPSRAAAQHFYDSELASALRRHVRRHCLEKN